MFILLKHNLEKVKSEKLIILNVFKFFSRAVYLIFVLPIDEKVRKNVIKFKINKYMWKIMHVDHLNV